MTRTKVNVHFMFDPTTVAAIQEGIPTNLHSATVENLVRNHLGLPVLRVEEQYDTFAVHKKKIDYGQGQHVVYVYKGIVVKQWLEGLHGNDYTGDGNPEWVGRPVPVIYGNGFRKERNQDRVSQAFVEWEHEEALSHYRSEKQENN